MANPSDLIDETFLQIRIEEEEVLIDLESGRKCKLCHWHGAGEIEAIDGTLADLINTPITMVEATAGIRSDGDNWTIFRLSSKNGHVSIRWGSV